MYAIPRVTVRYQNVCYYHTSTHWHLHTSDLLSHRAVWPVAVLRAEYVFHVFQMTSEKSVFCPKYVEYGGIRMEYMNTYSKRGPKMDVFRIKFSSLREFST